MLEILFFHYMFTFIPPHILWLFPQTGHKLNLPNHEACSFVNDIGSVVFVNVWNVIAGNPKPMPDDKFDILARTLIDS